MASGGQTATWAGRTEVCSPFLGLHVTYLHSQYAVFITRWGITSRSNARPSRPPLSLVPRRPSPHGEYRTAGRQRRRYSATPPFDTAATTTSTTTYRRRAGAASSGLRESQVSPLYMGACRADSVASHSARLPNGSAWCLYCPALCSWALLPLQRASLGDGWRWHTTHDFGRLSRANYDAPRSGALKS